MRTTLTLDEDVAAKLKAESRRLDRPFGDIVNETLRRGLAKQRPSGSTGRKFKVTARDLGLAADTTTSSLKNTETKDPDVMKFLPLLLIIVATTRAEFSLQFTNSSETSEFFNAGTFGNNTFLFVGDGGATSTSTDGLSWSSGSTGFTNSLQGAHYADGLFVACGSDGLIYESTNATKWMRYSTRSSTTFSEPAYDNGTWVIVGSGGTIWRKPPGGSWQRVTSPVTNSLVSVTFHQNTFYAAAHKFLLKSLDEGKTWQQMPADIDPNEDYIVRIRSHGGRFLLLADRVRQGLVESSCQLFYGNSPGALQRRALSNQFGRFLAFGSNIYVVGGWDWFATSFDGSNWTTRALPSVTGEKFWLGPVLHGMNRFALVAAKTTILGPKHIMVSQPIPQITFQPTATPSSWTLHGPAGRYEIQGGLPQFLWYSGIPPGVHEWQTIFTVTNNGTSSQITLPIQPEGTRFFRAIYYPTD